MAAAAVLCLAGALPSSFPRPRSTRMRNSPRRLSAAAASPPPPTEKPLRLTYLEINSWLWEVEGVTLLVDPVLVGNLDFGMPWLFDGAKKLLRNYQLNDLPDLDCLLITNRLDDHCHVRTLRQLSQKMPDLPVIATPNAEPILSKLFRNVTYLEPGSDAEVKGRSKAVINVEATAGTVLGPPWQRPENGYLVRSARDSLSLYYEPHCLYDQSFLEKYQADVVITPVIKQLLPAFTMVSGQEDAVHLAKLLNAKYIVPMNNADMDSKGILLAIMSSEGTIESFKALLSVELPDCEVLLPTPGVPLEISRLQSSLQP